MRTFGRGTWNRRCRYVWLEKGVTLARADDNIALSAVQEVASAAPLEGPGGEQGALLAACEAEIQRYKALQEHILVQTTDSASFLYVAHC